MISLIGFRFLSFSKVTYYYILEGAWGYYTDFLVVVNSTVCGIVNVHPLSCRDHISSFHLEINEMSILLQDIYTPSHRLLLSVFTPECGTQFVT